MKYPLVLFCTATLIISPLLNIAHATENFPAIENGFARLGDVELSCGALSQEASLMRDIVDNTQDMQNDSEMKGHGITAVGAVGSLILGTATAGIGLAAAGFLASEAVESEADQADNMQDIAAQRRSFMMGIFNAKGCYGPIEHVMQQNKPESIEVANISPHAGDEPHYND